MKRHEIPTHLNVPDRFLLGLTAKQAMQLIATASGSYGLLQQHDLPLELRVAGAGISVLMGLVTALIQPGGRALEEWALLIALHIATPAHMVWRPAPCIEVTHDGHWAALAPPVDWSSAREQEVLYVR